MYKRLKNKIFHDENGYLLTPLRHEDMENIRQWRNAQIEMLRQNHPITIAEQEAYFNTVVTPGFLEEKPRQMLFSFLFNDECIGYGGLTNIDWEAMRAEISFLLNPERVIDKKAYSRDFTHFLNLVIEMAFNDLYLHRLFTETFEYRVDHIKTLEHLGFHWEGTMHEHIYKKNQWHNSQIHGLLAKEWVNEQ